ncbi:hypothetical protein JCM6882_000499 [Rhodosporidiobolus microsporus]
MLDRFPVELLSHVLRLAAPLEYTPDKYRERRELLRRLCLVCKRVRDVAQPMLSEVFAVKEGEERADGGRLSRSSEVKILVISGRNSEVEAEAELQSLTEELTPLAGEISRFASNLSHRTPGFTSLHLLILPDKMKSSYPRVSVVEEARSALLEACDYCQIEVLYDEPLSWPDESLVSPVFWDWARRKMREKAEKGRIVEQGV